MNRRTRIELDGIGLDDLCNVARVQAERRGLSEVSAKVIVKTLVSPAARRKVINRSSIIQLSEMSEVIEGRPRLQ